MDQPLKAILACPDTSGQFSKWAIMLGEFNLAFQARPALKSQVLTDILVECIWSEKQSKESPVVRSGIELEGMGESWILHVDGTSNSQGSGTGLILVGPESEKVECALRLLFKAMNNQAEYEALLAGIRLVQELGVRHLRAFTDSQLIFGQLNG